MVFLGDHRRDDARRAWNLAVDQRPAAVALPHTVDMSALTGVEVRPAARSRGAVG